MRTSKGFWGTAIVALLLMGTSSANGQEEAEGLPPDEVTTGEVRISLSSDYAKVRVNGEEWDDHEFLDSGKQVVLTGLDRTVEQVISLRPIYSTLKPVDLTIRPSDWKLAPIGKRLKVWRVELRAVFAKADAKP
jgi:ABC-type proline/glycine betaine transport system substrate-binding protein